MAIQYAPLFALETQFQTKDGRNNTGGWLKVFLAATDDPATTYSDYNGTRNPEKIVLDDDGRAVVICDKSKAYRLEVYSIDGTLLWTEEPVYCSGTGGGGVSITKVISSDGSISVDRSVDGATTTYDIGLAPNDSDEFLEWIKCSDEDCGATWYPVFQGGSMETDAGKGIKVHGGHLYHFTNSFTVDPDGTGVNYDTFRVAMYCGDVIVDEHDFDIDSSLNDPVLCEFSRDVVPSEDTHVYFKLTISTTCKVSGEVQCHRIYSGINAVPDTCATKQWVSGSFQPLGGMSAYVPYSSVGNNSIGQVTGINGSAIVGGLDSASVSSIASSVASAYTESAFSSLSSKADSSALSAYQPVSAMGAYATTAYVDGMMSGKLDTTAFNSGDFYPTSNPSGFITGVDLGDYATTGFVESAVSGKLDTTAFNSGDFYTTANESGFVGSTYVASAVSGKLDTSAFASASAGFQPTGDYAYNSSLTSYIPASASGVFQPSGDYAFNSAVSLKLDASASGNFVMDSSMTSWIPYSALGYSGTAISGIGGSSLAGMGGGGVTGDYVEKSAMEVAIGIGSTAFDTAFAQGKACRASDRSFSQGQSNTASVNSLTQGQGNTVTNYSFAQGYGNSAQNTSFAQGYDNRAYADSFAQGRDNTASSNSLAQGYLNTATYTSFAQGLNNTATDTSFAQGKFNSADSNSFAQGSGNSARSNSFAQGSGNSARSNSFAQGESNSAVYTAAVFGTYNLHGNGSTSTGDSAAFAIGDGTALSARHDLMLVTKNGEITMYSSTADTVGLGLVSSIKAISASATGGVDSATVSAIASSYAESAVSGKLDSSASSDFVANSAMTSWIPYSALDYSGTAISGIGGSSLAGMGGGTGDYVEKSATEVAIGSGLTAFDTSFAQGINCSASETSFAQGKGNSAEYYSLTQGNDNTAFLHSFAQGSGNRASSRSFAQGDHNFASSTSLTQGEGNSASSNSFAQGLLNSASYNSFAQGYGNIAEWDSFAQGDHNSAAYTAAVFGTYNLHGNGNNGTGDSAAFAIGDGTSYKARHDLMLVTKNGEITMYSSTADKVGLGLVSSIKAISAAATGGVDSATVSAIASAYTTGKQDTLAFAYNTANQISSINGSALGGMDEAAVSGIASAYAQSAASGKLDTSAFNSGDFYSTSNPSGFITGVDLTPYQPTSAMSEYATTAYVTSGLSGKENVFSAGTGLEFVQSGSDRVLQVEAPVDIVAGPGIVIDNPDGNTLRVSTEADAEVVLYDGELKQVTKDTPVSGNVLSETFRNFKRVLLIGHTDDGTKYPFSILLEPLNSSGDMEWSVAVSNAGWCKWFCGKLNDTTITLTLGRVLTMGTTNWDYLQEWTINKVVGIHRIANN